MIAASLGALLLGSAVPPTQAAGPELTEVPATEPVDVVDTSREGQLPPAALLAEFDLPPPTAQEALERGVLVVVSLDSQHAFVFRKGELWDSTAVSTGKKGHATPTGEFPILQKKVDHRSSLYDDAPMPYMQRLTWDGVALHAGRVPGYPASHGCIRLPKDFAKKLYGITNFSSTVVVVTKEGLGSANEARAVV
jgi:lipoprotein-anchoring transpeptidase ErfK/SrfK